MVGTKPPVHLLLGGQGLDVQQRTSVWIGLPKSWNHGGDHVTLGTVTSWASSLILVPRSLRMPQCRRYRVAPIVLIGVATTSKY